VHAHEGAGVGVDGNEAETMGHDLILKNLREMLQKCSGGRAVAHRRVAGEDDLADGHGGDCMGCHRREALQLLPSTLAPQEGAGTPSAMRMRRSALTSATLMPPRYLRAGGSQKETKGKRGCDCGA
jgi:hypothetical protein